MSTELITLLVIGAAFIIFGIFVLFLPEVRERGEKKALAKEEKDKKKKRGFFFWLFDPKRLPLTGSAMGVTAFVTTAVILAAVPRTAPNNSSLINSSTTLSETSSEESSAASSSTGSSQTTTSTVSSEVTTSTPSSETAGSVFTEGELPNWDLSNPTLGLATDLGFNHTIDFVNYTPKVHEKDYMVWGYERYDNIPSSILDNLQNNFQAIRYSTLRMEIYNAFTGDFVFEFEFDPGEAYRTAYLNDGNATQTQESLSFAFDGDSTLLVAIQPSFKTAGSNGAVYEKAGAYQGMIDYLNQEVADGKHTFLLKFDLSNPTTYTVIDYYFTESNRQPVNYQDLVYVNGTFIMVGTSGSNVNVNFNFVKAYLNSNFMTLIHNQQIYIEFTLTGSIPTFKTLFAFPTETYVNLQPYKDGLIQRMFDHDGRPSFTLNKPLGTATTFAGLESAINNASAEGIDDTYFDSLKASFVAEIPAFQLSIEEQFPTTLPTMQASVTFTGFLAFSELDEDGFSLSEPKFYFSLSHRNNSSGLFIGRNFSQTILKQTEGYDTIIIETKSDELMLSYPLNIEGYYLSSKNIETQYFTFDPLTETKTEILSDLDGAISLNEIIVHENGYYGSGVIRDNEDINAILISFDTNLVETARFVPEGSKTDVGAGFVTSPLGDPVWTIYSFSNDGDYQPFAIDLPEGAGQMYWVQFNRVS